MYLYPGSQISCVAILDPQDAPENQWGARQIAHDDPCDDAVRHEACLGASMQGLQKLWNQPLQGRRAFCHARRGSEVLGTGGTALRLYKLLIDHRGLLALIT